MPERVACPGCDCRFLVNQTRMGRPIRCVACEQMFEAGEPPDARGTESITQHPRGPKDEEIGGLGIGPAHLRLPLCPACDRPVGWVDLGCDHCGHQFDPADREDRASWCVRQEAPAHRGVLIGDLGHYTLFGGALAACTGPLGVLFAVILGIPTWWMASKDLQGMDAGWIDPDGRAATRQGKDKAVAGLVLALMFGVFWTLVVSKL